MLKKLWHWIDPLPDSDSEEADEDTSLLPPPPTRSYEEYYQDEPEDMTRGRRIARYLSQYSWYFNSNRQQNRESQADGGNGATATTTTTAASEDNGTSNQDGPSLDAAWAYFEHVTLARYLLSNDAASSSARDTMRRAEAGETTHPTRLYNVWSTPEKDLGDFGLGIGELVV